MNRSIFRHAWISSTRLFSSIEPPPGVQRSSIQLFRDCMRLVRHIAPGNSRKAMALKSMVRSQFDAGKAVTDPQQVTNLKANAVRGLANYMLFESGSKDPTLSKAMTKFHDSSVANAKQGDKGAGDSGEK